MEYMGKLSSSTPPFGEIKMRPELQAKLLQHLNKKKADGGFTLVELLVVVIIIGILAAIALPSYLNLTATSKQSEGRQNLASVIHAQQVWATENPTYAATFDLLATGVVKGSTVDSSTSTVYTYNMANGSAGTTNAAPNNYSFIGATAKDAKLKAYVGGVNTYLNAASQQTWSSTVCEATVSGTAVPTAVAIATTVSSESGPGITPVRKAKVAGDVECADNNQNEVKVAGK
jgi:type IV pilus assembly protein PilA